MIKSFAKFQNENSDNGMLNIVGDGSHMKILQSLVKTKNIKNVRFWGRYPLDTMPRFYQQSDVLFLSLTDNSIYELTIPLKFQTYLTAGAYIWNNKRRCC